LKEIKMVKTASTMLPLGTKAPDFELVNVDGRTVSLANYEGKQALVLIFMCNHCPFVKHIAQGLAQLGRDYHGSDVAIVAINSNDVSSHPDDSPEQMIHEVEQQGYVFDYLFDEDQSVAKAYRAACTPDFYVFDAQQQLAYRGQFDSSRPDSGIAVTGEDLRAAIEAVRAGQPAPEEQKPSLGCNIKWVEGAAPEYFNPLGVS